MDTPQPEDRLDVQVLIVGGGPVGLTASLLLSRLGVESLLVERHPDTARLPKARAINARSMEMYGQLGLEDEIRAVGMDPRFSKMILWSESLAGREIHRLVPGRLRPESERASPTTNCGCSQDMIEPVLRRHAEAAAPGRVRFDMAMTGLAYTADAAQGELVDRATGATTHVHARYVIAADGAQSTIRRQLPVEMLGEFDVYDSVNIHFKADLTRWVADRPAALYLIEQPQLRGTFLTINGTDRWSFLVTSISHYGYRPEQFDADYCAQVIRQAVGVEELEIEVLGVGAWSASAIVADRYRDGPVFLTGDAAHEMPPTGGLGLNTGVQDVQNLAWKFAAVLRDGAGEHLLDSYDAERRPLATLTTRSSLLNALSMGRASRQAEPVLPRREFLNEQGLVFGAQYVSDAVLDDAHAAPAWNESVTEYVPTAMPGYRAPHVWLAQDGARRSTIELFGQGFVLLAGPGGRRWAEAAASLAAPRVQPYVIGEDLVDADQHWVGVYAAGPETALLVRPDGVIAWRVERLADDPVEMLAAALDRILARETKRPTEAFAAVSAEWPADVLDEA